MTQKKFIKAIQIQQKYNLNLKIIDKTKILLIIGILNNYYRNLLVLKVLILLIFTSLLSNEEDLGTIEVIGISPLPGISIEKAEISWNLSIN